MAESAIERYKKDQALQQETKTVEGERKELNEVQESFLKALEGITEPTPPVRYLRPFNPFQKEDKSLTRLILSGFPELKIYVDKKLSEKQKKIAKLAGDPRRIDKPDFKVLQSRRKNKNII